VDEQLLENVAEDDIREYLIFSVDTIDFGIDIGLVQEIIKLQPVSKIPNALPFCSGIINIRGTIVPVLDMRIKLGFPSRDYDERACIIVILLESELVGAIVDAVQDVIHISAQSLIDSPALSAGQLNYTTKIASIDGKIKQLLDVPAVFGVEEE
jgi:purine-binding chemotaxis protein CheW